MGKLLAVVVAAGDAALVDSQMPELRRYLKIRKM